MKGCCFQTTKESVLAVARKDCIPTKPAEIIKDPMFLEFLGLKGEARYYEQDLESALITHLQEFLLRVGQRLFIRCQTTPNPA